MRECKPVSIPRGAFIFCRTALAVLFWISFIFKIKWMVSLSFVLLALSAILKIERAPLIVLYSNTVNKIKPSRNEILDEGGMRFAHTFGSVLTLLCLVFLYLINEKIGWILVFLVTIAKTAGAMGFCSALKLYGCMSSDSCCSFIKAKK